MDDPAPPGRGPGAGVFPLAVLGLDLAWLFSGTDEGCASLPVLVEGGEDFPGVFFAKASFIARLCSGGGRPSFLSSSSVSPFRYFGATGGNFPNAALDCLRGLPAGRPGTGFGGFPVGLGEDPLGEAGLGGPLGDTLPVELLPGDALPEVFGTPGGAAAKGSENWVKEGHKQNKGVTQKAAKGGDKLTLGRCPNNGRARSFRGSAHGRRPWRLRCTVERIC